MKVLIAGYFDPLHDGHLDHILKAAKLGDHLIIVMHTDDCTERVKGNRFTTEGFRRFVLEAIIHHLGKAGEVVTTREETVAKIIRELKPNLFAKGGDRIASNMPAAEIEACASVKCAIAYGVGDLLNSSSEIKRRLKHGNAD